jgi:hypothetical protein
MEGGAHCLFALARAVLMKIRLKILVINFVLAVRSLFLFAL